MHFRFTMITILSGGCERGFEAIARLHKKIKCFSTNHPLDSDNIEGGPGGIRTLALRIRSPVPYPNLATGPQRNKGVRLIRITDRKKEVYEKKVGRVIRPRSS